MSILGAIISVIAGLFLQSVLYVTLGIYVDNVLCLLSLFYGWYFQ